MVSPLMLIVKQIAQSKNSSKSENKMTKKMNKDWEGQALPNNTFIFSTKYTEIKQTNSKPV